MEHECGMVEDDKLVGLTAVLSVPVNYVECGELEIRQNFQLGLWPCTICSLIVNINCRRITHNVWCIYSVRQSRNTFKEK